ncbi:hypothetical protein SLEP1_g49088 [Rubroshorea leprosula]|uniref:Uncharacterized protein n=1 Tax=Rubroshorea leprosula TaxID=152421 RepID=A0AAV5LWM2_9ROSI|nr:hypothetical protein SLEP1_g49088 [Rubroshorea leprosula]
MSMSSSSDISPISPVIITQTSLSSFTAKQAWDAIELAYHDQLEANAILYSQEYAALRKEPNQSMIEYLQHAKKIADQLYSINDPVSDRDLVLRVLAGLDSSYSVSKCSIPQRVPFPSFLQLRSLLLIEEANLQHENSQNHATESFSSPQVLLLSTVQQQQRDCSGTSRAQFIEHKGAIGWSIVDIKGVSPSVCMHKILLDEGHKPIVQPQRHLNPNMQEVVIVINSLAWYY